VCLAATAGRTPTQSALVGRSRDSIHTAGHKTDSTVLSCLAGGVNWALADHPLVCYNRVVKAAL